MPGEAHFSGHIDRETLDEFDELFDCGTGGSRSRSAALRECIQIGIRVKSGFRATEYEFDSEREEMAAITEAIRRLAYDDFVADT